MQLSVSPQLPSDLDRCLTQWFDRYATGDLAGTPVLLAVSGGSDSLALLHAVVTHCRQVGRLVQAITVDHALRPEAVAEASAVSEICRKMGVQHQTRRLSWPSGASVSQAKARRARYAVISTAAREIGAKLILTGHTLDDQMETVFMRLNSGSDMWGLAGMADCAPLPVWPEGEGLWLGRPLLSQRRHRLREFLSLCGLSWIEDPSNELERYERVRTRRLLSSRPGLQHQLLGIVRAASKARQSQCDRLSRWAHENVRWDKGGAAVLPVMPLRELHGDDQVRLLQALLMCVSGAEHQIAASRLSGLNNDPKVRAGRTLGRCEIKQDGNDILVTAEVPTSRELSTDFQEESLIWAGRIKLSGDMRLLREFDWQPWGERPVREALRTAALPPFVIRKSLPVGLLGDGSIAIVPHMERKREIYAEDLGTSRLFRLFRHQTEVFEQETRLGESFSPPSSTMLEGNQ